jgi:hypothetical protein
MRKYTNQAGVPLSMAVFLATDNYDYQSGEKVISATSLLKPMRALCLAHRVPPGQDLVEVTSMVQSRMGSALHDAIERAWVNDPSRALHKLGYPESVIKRVRVNPDPNTLKEGDIPVYLEQRNAREIGGYRVSGKFDFVGEGRLEDFKSTGVFTWMNNTKDKDYILQGSIYRWLNPKIITSDTMAIQFIFTDWSAAMARANPNYPKFRTMERRLGLLSLPETENFIRGRLSLLDRFIDAPQDDLPRCTDEELWRSEPAWKYYKNPEAVAKGGRSTKNFDDKQEAYLRMAQDGNVGRVVEIPGKAKACNYCPAFPVCKQAQDLIASGDLDV